MIQPGKTHRVRIRTAERRAQCVALRLAGATYPAIAAQVGITPRAAYEHVKQHMEETARKSGEDATALRALENERLDRMQMGIWNRAINGDETAIDRVLKIIERRSRINGTDAPTKVAPTTPDGMEPYEGGGLAEMLAQARKEKAK